MKKLIAMVLSLLLVPCVAQATAYHTYGTVECIDYVDGVWKVVDMNGNVWILAEPEDMEIWDIVELTIDNCGTADFTDDEIIEWRYTGFNANDHVRGVRK